MTRHNGWTDKDKPYRPPSTEKNNAGKTHRLFDWCSSNLWPTSLNQEYCVAPTIHNIKQNNPVQILSLCPIFLTGSRLGVMDCITYYKVLDFGLPSFTGTHVRYNEIQKQDNTQWFQKLQQSSTDNSLIHSKHVI